MIILIAHNKKTAWHDSYRTPCVENSSEKTYIGSPDNPKTAAAVSYITFIGWLISYFGLYRQNKSQYSAFHLRQSLLLHIISFLVNAAYSFTPTIAAPLIIEAVVAIILFVLWLIGFWRSLNGSEKPIPLIGQAAQKFFYRI